MMTNIRPDHLPDFKNPPLDEVSMSVQFKELRRYQSVHHGLLYQQFRDDFPRFEEHSPLPTRFETFGRSSEQVAEFDFSDKPPIRRAWFVSEDGHRLVQIQPNRYVHNWRKVEDSGIYPHYENIIPTFFAGLSKIEEFAKSNNLGEIDINQCELSYFNNIYAKEGESLGDLFDHIFVFWRPGASEFSFAKAKLQRETPNVKLSYRVQVGGNEEPTARLSIEISPAVHRKTGNELLRVSLIFRGRPSNQDHESIGHFLDAGRDAIVELFTSITSKNAHDEWSRVK